MPRTPSQAAFCVGGKSCHRVEHSLNSTTAAVQVKVAAVAVTVQSLAVLRTTSTALQVAEQQIEAFVVPRSASEPVLPDVPKVLPALHLAWAPLLAMLKVRGAAAQLTDCLSSAALAPLALGLWSSACRSGASQAWSVRPNNAAYAASVALVLLQHLAQAPGETNRCCALHHSLLWRLSSLPDSSWCAQSPQLPAVEAALAALPDLCLCGEGAFLARRLATQAWPLASQLLRCAADTSHLPDADCMLCTCAQLSIVCSASGMHHACYLCAACAMFFALPAE